LIHPKIGVWRDVAGAFSLLTILPAHVDPQGRPLGHIYAYFPVVGLVVGLGLVGTAWGAGQVFSPSVAAWLTLAVWVGVTGGLHLDGLADSCDGLWAWKSPEKRLEIMKDSRAGAWAVVGVGVFLLGKWSALGDLRPAYLLLPPILGRWAIVLVAYLFPDARLSGSANVFRVGFGRPQFSLACFFMLSLTLGIAGALGRADFLLLPPLALLIALGFGRWASAKLGGGLTGDVYGATCELTELALLLALGLLR